MMLTFKLENLPDALQRRSLRAWSERRSERRCGTPTKSVQLGTLLISGEARSWNPLHVVK